MVKQEESELNQLIYNEELEYLNKIYEQNINKIIAYSTTIKYSFLVGVFSMFLFLILVMFRLSYTFSIFFLLLMCYSSIISFTIFLNSYLMLKNLFDGKKDVSNFGSILSYFSLNTISVCTLIYSLLITLKVEGIINANSMNSISVSLYFAFAIAFLYWIFILPGIAQNKLYIEIFIVTLYLICSFAFLVLLNYRLDGSIKTSYFHIFLLWIFALGFHFIYLVIICFVSLKEEMTSKLCAITFLLFSLTSFLLLSLKLDGNLNSLGNWIPILIFFVGLILLTAEKIYDSFKEAEIQAEKEFV